MIDLASAAAKLGDAKREGRRYLCRCPNCGAHAAWVMEGKDHTLKAGCFACGDWRAVKDAIGDRDFQPSQSAERARTPLERMQTAQRFWDETILLPHTAAESYLVDWRKIEGPFPDTLRFHRAPWHFSGFYPALVARIERFPGFTFAGVHLTYLAKNGDKAGVDPD
jgi:hypothetical protein